MYGELRHVAREKEFCVKYVFRTINKGQIDTNITSKETQLSIILNNALPFLVIFFDFHLKMSTTTWLSLHPIIHLQN